MSKPSDTAARWREVVREQTRSGLSVAAYCRRARVPVSSLCAWRRKLRERGALSSAGRPTATFAEVRVTPEWASGRGNGTPSVAGVLEVRLANGRRIVVQPGFDRQTLLEVVTTLEAGE